jgi:hypothetical protein
MDKAQSSGPRSPWTDHRRESSMQNLKFLAYSVAALALAVLAGCAHPPY